MDWNYLNNLVPLYKEAAALTLCLAVEAFVLSLIIGLVLSIVLCLGWRAPRYCIGFLVQVGRNVPVLVLLYFLFFGLVRHGVHLEAHTCAVLALAAMGGAYMAEAFRAAWLAVDRSQFESAKSLGLGRFQVLWYVVWPQALAVAVPSLLANAHAILMETAMCGFISVPELMSLTRDQIGMYYKTYECFFALTICYALLLLPFSLLAGYTERRLRNA